VKQETLERTRYSEDQRRRLSNDRRACAASPPLRRRFWRAGSSAAARDVLLKVMRAGWSFRAPRAKPPARAKDPASARDTLLPDRQERTIRERPPGLLDMYPSQQTNQKIARSLDSIVHLRSDVCVRIWRGVRVRSSFSSCVCFPAAVASAARVRFLRRGDVLPLGDARELELRGGKDAPRSSSRAQEAHKFKMASRRTSCAMLTSSESTQTQGQGNEPTALVGL